MTWRERIITVSSIAGECGIGTKDPAPFCETISALSRFTAHPVLWRRLGIGADAATAIPPAPLTTSDPQPGSVGAKYKAWMPLSCSSYDMSEASTPYDPRTADSGTEQEPRQPQHHPGNPGHHPARPAGNSQPEPGNRNQPARTRQPEPASRSQPTGTRQPEPGGWQAVAPDAGGS